MGIFGSIKKAMGGGGGVGLKLEAPKSFTWEDQKLELQVTLSGHKEETRSIERIEFQLQDIVENQGNDNSSNSGQSGNIVDYLWDFNESIELRPKAEHTVTVTMPLPFTSSASTPLVESDAVGGFIGKMLSSVSTGPPTNVRNYQLTARAFMEDVKGSANASRNIRYGGAFKMNTNIGGIRFT